MSNIRIFYPEKLSINLETNLSKSQSHYLLKVMRIKPGETFSVFNKFGEWKSIVTEISKNSLNFKVVEQLRQKDKEQDIWLAFSPIKSNYKLAILSNGTPDLLNELVISNKLKDIFDDIFSVEEAGIFKPDSKVYDLPINKYNIEKNEVLFLSANTWDVSGAGNYGYNTVWVNRNNNIFDKLDFEPNKQISNLSQLLDLI